MWSYSFSLRGKRQFEAQKSVFEHLQYHYLIFIYSFLRGPADFTWICLQVWFQRTMSGVGNNRRWPALWRIQPCRCDLDIMLTADWHSWSAPFRLFQEVRCAFWTCTPCSVRNEIYYLPVLSHDSFLKPIDREIKGRIFNCWAHAPGFSSSDDYYDNYNAFLFYFPSTTDDEYIILEKVNTIVGLEWHYPPVHAQQNLDPSVPYVHKFFRRPCGASQQLHARVVYEWPNIVFLLMDFKCYVP